MNPIPSSLCDLPGASLLTLAVCLRQWKEANERGGGNGHRRFASCLSRRVVAAAHEHRLNNGSNRSLPWELRAYLGPLTIAPGSQVSECAFASFPERLCLPVYSRFALWACLRVMDMLNRIWVTSIWNVTHIPWRSLRSDLTKTKTLGHRAPTSLKSIY